MPAPDTILRLIDRFDRNKDEYKNPGYNETQLRREFLDPFFGELGWDVENKQGHAEAYKDVVHEDAIKVGSATKAPDYSFRIGGMRKFFVEAKKPYTNLKEDVSPAFQLRRYAWSAKLPLSILSDFQEFVVFDCRIKPSITDKASTARTLYVTYDAYEKQWDEIYNIFSHEAVLKGSFDKYAETNRLKKGTAEVDDAFLKEIESWRDTLARTIALRNTKLTQRELNFAVQRTIDRIIFLRICEDRGVETYGTLMALQNGERIYKKLCELFYRADEKYNSGLFHFQQEKGRPEIPDELTLTLDIDDKPLKEIIKGLYYPDSPYEFSVLPADILGQVYEQFLGKVIRLTTGHRAVVEDKPEVKKAGGVYYTPTYIVEYIVKNTVGRLIGDRGQGLGDREGGTDGAAIVQRTGSMETGNDAGRGNLSADGSVSTGGAVRINEPDAPGVGLDSGEHSGGLRPDSQGGLPASSLNREGISDGIGNTSGNLNQSEISDGGTIPDSSGINSGSQQNAHSINSATVSPLNPNPSTPIPQPSTLTPAPYNTPKQVSKLRILDPACGSGSFLIGAYQYLLDWHRDWYVKDGIEKWTQGRKATLYQGQGGDWRLTTSEQKRILLNNIYGVDIDAQTVEVTKLSLLLKVLEGENEQTLLSQLKLFHERALPDLGDNIKCGNSLIGPDFYDGQQLSLMDEEERLRINVFDWNKEFTEGMKDGGFDAVIGNPPYIFARDEGFNESEKEYYYNKFKLSQYQLNTYIMFTEQGHNILKKNGSLGYIIPNNWLTIDTTSIFRTFVLEKCKNKIIINSYDKVFQEANVDTSILIFEKSGSDSIICNKMLDGKIEFIITTESKQFLDGNTNIINFETIASPEVALLCNKIKNISSTLDILAIVKAGIKAYEVGKGKPAQTEEMKNNRVYHTRKIINKSYIKYLDGVDIARYFIGWSGQFIKYGINLAAPRDSSLFNGKRILVRQIPAKPPYSILASIVNETVINDLNSMIIKPINDKYSLEYFLGILNSRMMSFWFNATFGKLQRKLFPQFKIKELALFPIKKINLSNSIEKNLYDQMIYLVTSMLDLHKKLFTTKTDHEKTIFIRQIESTDKKIDALVYELYGLTEEEIKIVEGGDSK